MTLPYKSCEEYTSNQESTIFRLIHKQHTVTKHPPSTSLMDWDSINSERRVPPNDSSKQPTGEKYRWVSFKHWPDPT